MSTPLAMGQLTGYDIDRKVDFCLAGAAFSKGDVVTVTAVVPSTSGGTRTVLAPTTTSIRYGVHGVIMDNCASGDMVQVCFKGIVQAFVKSSSGLFGLLAQLPLNVLTTKDLNCDPPQNLPRVIAARVLEDTANVAISTTRALRWVWFDGTQTGYDWGSAGSANAVRFGGFGSNIADSAAIASTASKTAFDKTIAIPIGTLNLAGVAIIVRANGQYSTTGTPTLTIGLDLDLGGAAPVVLHAGVASAALGSGVSNKQWRAEWLIIPRSVSTTVGTISTSVQELNFDAAGVGAIATTATNVDTTLARTLSVAATWSASSASNTITLEAIQAERVF